MSVSRLQAAVAATAEALSVVLLFVAGTSLLLIGIFGENGGEPNDDEANKKDGVTVLLRVMGALVLSYSCCAGVLLSPLIHDCVQYQHRHVRALSLQCSCRFFRPA